MTDARRILVDARTPVNYAMFAPVHQALTRDARVDVSFVASEDPGKAAAIFAAAGKGGSIVSPARAALLRFDAYVTSDFTWATLLRRPCRIQMFHGVGGKYGFDAPTESLRAWDRLFFVNRRRLANCIAAGAIDADSATIRLIGMPKVDCLVDGTLRRDAVLATLGLPAERPTLLYAPTWSPASSLNTLGLNLIERLRQLPINLIVKLHDRSRDLRPHYSGGVDWATAIQPHLEPGSSILASSADICPYLAAADVMITDHSSAGFEYLLLDRPLVRIHLPALIANANVHPDYVEMLSDVSEPASDVRSIVAAVERALADPSRKSAARQAIAADLFHAPGTATARCVDALYDAMNLAGHPARALSTRDEHLARSTRHAHPAPGTQHEHPTPSTQHSAPVVTVIMPAFNAERYLGRAIESVRRQTFPNFELLIVDDGSTDGTAGVANAYAVADARVRVLRQANAGPGPARNAAFAIARGRLFAFLDSDDEWDATFLEEMIAMLDARPDIDVLIGNARKREGPHQGQPCRPLRGTGAPITLAEILSDECALFIMAVFRREAVEAVGGFDPGLFTNEEYDMWIRAATAGFTFSRYSKPLGWYACRADSLSASDSRMLHGIVRVLAKTRARLQPGSAERTIVERQIARFEAEARRVDARRSIARGEVTAIVRHAVHAFDDRLRQWSRRRTILIYARNAMHLGVLDPLVQALERDPRVTVSYLAEARGKQAHIDQATGRPHRWTTAARARWSRVDVLVTADPWSPPALLRAHRRMNVFHGVAGKYDLDDPRHLPIAFDQWDRVAFVNADRMQRYLNARIVKPGAAVLVGYPKLDALVDGRIDGAAVQQRLGLDTGRRTALYAPTWSPASSLNTAGDTIIGSLVDAGFNVIVKPHDLSFDLAPKYSGGIDWHTRLHTLERAGRIVVAHDADSSPLMAASDVLITDHSSIGFEFCLLDRPIVVVDAPDLARVARINPERIDLLRSAAVVVADPGQTGAAALAELDEPARRHQQRAAISRLLFHEPGSATARLVATVYDLLDLEPRSAAAPAAHHRPVEASPL